MEYIMEKCKADVTICGNDYVLSGDKSEDKIKEIAKYVDDELRHTSKMLNSNPNYRSAVLTAINLAEKLMDNSDLLLKLQTENHQLDNDVKHYIRMVKRLSIEYYRGDSEPFSTR